MILYFHQKNRKKTICSSCSIEIVIVHRIITSVKYQLYEGDEDQKSELIIEVEMR
jgi:hypothetical protein